MNEIKHISNEEYQKVPAMSFTALKEFIKSPAHYYSYFNGERENKETSARRLGSAAHCAVLEPDVFESTYRVVDGNRNTKKVKDEIEEYSVFGYKVINSKEYKTAVRIRDAVLSDSVVGKLFVGGHSELSIFSTDIDTGAPIKCRPDYYHREAGVCLDLKTYTEVETYLIEKQVKRMAYDLQALHYLNVLSSESGKSLRLFGNVFVEPEPPYTVTLVGIDDETLTSASNYFKYKENLLKYKECLDNDAWPNRVSEPINLKIYRGIYE